MKRNCRRNERGKKDVNKNCFLSKKSKKLEECKKKKGNVWLLSKKLRFREGNKRNNTERSRKRRNNCGRWKFKDKGR
jgi:hypothetical protein